MSKPKSSSQSNSEEISKIDTIISRLKRLEVIEREKKELERLDAEIVALGYCPIKSRQQGGLIKL